MRSPQLSPHVQGLIDRAFTGSRKVDAATEFARYGRETLERLREARATFHPLLHRSQRTYETTALALAALYRRRAFEARGKQIGADGLRASLAKAA